MICDSPSEIYHYALPFSPSSSWPQEAYSSVLSQEVKVVKGLQPEWGACFRTVNFDKSLWALACWDNLVAVGSQPNNITILNAVTGISMSVLSSHTELVWSLAFSSNGKFLVSGSQDNTVCLWDIQTGGVISTFHGHTEWIFSVSISPDCAMIASGSGDHTIRLWNIQTGKCHCVIEGHSSWVYSVSFSPTNSQFLWSASHDGTIQQWDIEGHQIGSTYKGNYVALSSHGSNFVSWWYGGTDAIVQDSDSGEVIAKLRSPGGGFYCCCFSPDGRLIACGAGNSIYIWDITNSDPCLVETFIEHTGDITSLVFSSSLISSSKDKSIKFWQIGASTMDPVATDLESIPVNSAAIESVSLQATEGIAISSDSAGVVKIWDILTGLCKESFQTPAKGNTWRDVQLIDGRLTLVWLQDEKICVWEAKKREPLQVLDTQVPDEVLDFRIAGDKSKVFVLDKNTIQAWSIVTGEVVGEVKFEGEPLCDSLVIDGSRVWAYFKDLQVQGWDFRLLDSAPVPLSNISPDRPHLHFIGTRWQQVSPSRIEDTTSKKEFFRLSGKYVEPDEAQWDGRYLITGYESGEVLILDFAHLICQ